jgi:thiol-disulfide isomerase/thioredoxin
MIQSLIRIASLFSLLLAMAGQGGAYAAEKAINFQFSDLDGKPVRLSDFQGKWVLVNFWAPWCPLCWPEVPVINELNKRKDFVVIGVGMDYGPDEQSVRNAIAQHGLNYQAYVLGGSRRDPYSAYRQVGPVDFYPTSYLYAPNGEIVMFIPGQLRKDRLLAFMSSYKEAVVDTSEEMKAVAEPVRTSPQTSKKRPARKKKTST